MKKTGHPDYHDINVIMTDGEKYVTKSTWGKPGDTMTLEVDPKSHNAWTGGERKLMQSGQLSRFKDRFSKFGMDGDKANAKDAEPAKK